MKCFEYCESKQISCQKKNCKYWIEHREKNNCTVLASKDGPMTLQEIGEIFGVTRMRICQIEKKILKTLSSQISKHPYF
jgi:DNA-directed RNA polymerase sigma subunit (sigma70/sigma32)